MMRRVQDSRRPDGPGQAGSATVEAAIALPAFALLVLLAVMGGRVTLAHQDVQAAAADAARAASLARTATDAAASGRRAGLASLANQHLDCLGTDVRIDTAGFRTPVGQPATVTASITCGLDLTDLLLPGIPDHRAITATMTSPLDTWRERTER